MLIKRSLGAALISAHSRRGRAGVGGLVGTSIRAVVGPGEALAARYDVNQSGWFGL